MKTISIKRMSRLALLAAFLILMKPSASAELLIYKVKGDVFVRSNAKKVKAERRSIVSPYDMLTIPSGGAVDILDSRSHRIYSSLESGNMTVKTLMQKAEAQASSITKNINKKVIAAVADNASNKKSGYEAMGMTIHETDAIACPPLTISDGTSYLAYLLANPTEPDSAHQSYISLKKQLIERPEGEDDGAFNFVVHNSLRQPLYFNVITKAGDDDISLYFPQNPIAAPKSETVAAEYTYLPDNNISGYVVIASDVDFSVDDVKRLLEADFDPDDDYYLSVLSNN